MTQVQELVKEDTKYEMISKYIGAAVLLTAVCCREL